MTDIILNNIFIYPVKSLAGIEVGEWPVDNKGLQYDRRWILVDDNNQFLSQRRVPEMALIKTRIQHEQLILSAPGHEPLTLPLTPDTTRKTAIQIWKDQCQAAVLDERADQWLSDFLKISCRLVFQPDDEIRPVDPDYATSRDQTSFSDGFPFLLLSDASLSALNQAMQLELSIIRFRPNLVVSGCEPYAEDSWREIRIGEITFRLPKPCSRCAVPTIDPETAEKDKEPLKTLQKIRKWNKHVYFGQNALHDKTGKLKTGMKVEIIKTGDAQPPL